jgi:hypothetical protein
MFSILSCAPGFVDLSKQAGIEADKARQSHAVGRRWFANRASRSRSRRPRRVTDCEMLISLVLVFVAFDVLSE